MGNVPSKNFSKNTDWNEFEKFSLFYAYKRLKRGTLKYLDVHLFVEISLSFANFNYPSVIKDNDLEADCVMLWINPLKIWFIYSVFWIFRFHFGTHLINYLFLWIMSAYL